MPRIDVLGTKDSFYVVEVDEGSPTSYFGFMDSLGNWYILAATESGNTVSYRYYKGSLHDAFQTAWANRASLPYTYPTIF